MRLAQLLEAAGTPWLVATSLQSLRLTSANPSELCLHGTFSPGCQSGLPLPLSYRTSVLTFRATQIIEDSLSIVKILNLITSAKTLFQLR